MSTIESRLRIGFPDKREDWTRAPAVYDNGHSLRIAGHPIMEEWEQGYMERLAEIASSNGGRVLEVGYGLGLSSRAIQSRGIEEHYIIECHPGVIERCLKDFGEVIGENRMHLVSGFWEEVTPLIASGNFDGILFDTYPLKEEQIHSNHFWFFKEAYRLLKPGGVLTYYSDEVSDLSETHIAKLEEAGFKREDISYEVCAVNPPEDCEYWQAKTIVVPIVKKPL